MNNKVKFITIIVCTYNRADILKECLTALFNQTAPSELYEVLVVDNNSHDHTKQVVNEYQKKFSNLRYILEKEQGLSYARNTGYINSDALWVGYMDDDGKAHRDYIEKTLEVIHNYNFDCFGGRYYAWHKVEKPKWLHENFGESPLKASYTNILTKGYNDGGIIFFNRLVLQEMNGFPVNLGMSGNKIAYGEETELQNKLRANNYKIGYSPDICMDHLVAEYKLKVKWHLKAAYAQGRDGVILWNKKSNKISRLFFIYKLLITLFNNLILFKRLLKNEYYYQNFLIDFLSPVYNWFGVYNATNKINHVRN